MKRQLRERTLHFQEMSNLRPKISGLLVNIWVDESKKYKGHAKRIKFQTNYHPQFQNCNCSMLLDGTIPPSIKKGQSYLNREISNEDIQQISNFVINNSYALEKLADNLIWMDDFKEIMIKGGQLAKDFQIDELKRKVNELVEINQKEFEKYGQ